ncbi:Cytochrome c554 and c-prime [Desulfonauticus submarinus]|uniref:Cytochrome c554 and c-prime n=1 Tax=Desulfonauticus submarinus TaxID=206665 RepID=A0A1H0D5V5_9BACT|nr:cytochrome c family protein [Desulfonauticus submarinus]SDN65550.1 Cytochrome c554 and c-prime [Desulfonauticus submarinus]
MMKRCIFSIIVLSFFIFISVNVNAGDYVGSKQCGECHEKEYKNFITYSKKAKSFEHIKKMFPKLEERERQECYACHTTGYGKGGFISYEKTPELSDVGCETCHGPGKEHVESGGDPELIRLKMDLKTCNDCHTSERVKTFNFKPLLYGGVH